MMKQFLYIIIISFLIGGSIEREINIFHAKGVVEISAGGGYGTGFIVDPSGIIVTNAHVIDQADEVIIRTKEKKEYKVTGYYAISHERDYAILQINSKKNERLPVLRLGDSNKVKVGDDIIAVGNPRQLSHTITQGIISSRRQCIIPPCEYENRDEEFLQIDATIAGGSSGGPLFNTNFEVIGVTTAGYLEDLNFAIPINQIKRILKYKLPLEPYSKLIKLNEERRRNFWYTEEGKETEEQLMLECQMQYWTNFSLSETQIENFCRCYTQAIKNNSYNGDPSRISKKERERIRNYLERNCY